MATKRSMNPFENAKKLVVEHHAPVFEKFMVNKVLSCSPLTFPAAMMSNKFLGLPDWAVTDLLNLTIDKSKVEPRFFWIKRSATVNKVLNKKIRTHFCLNDRHADEVIELLRRMDVKPEQFFGLKEGE